jgi:hypothetical protein
VQVIEDPVGHFAQEFHALTSGQTALYDPAGNCLFSGGITDGRGHEGPSRGAQEIASLIAGHKSNISETPVFGCSLLGGCTTTNQK